MPFVSVFGLAALALWIFCIIDVIRTPDGEPNYLPKFSWLIIVIILPTVGAIVWLILGRPRQPITHRPTHQHPSVATRYPEYDRPGRHVAQNPDDDEAFLRQLRERAEQQRRTAREQARKRDQEQGE